jgi:hypothetical protein
MGARLLNRRIATFAGFLVTISISDILDVLGAHDIRPHEGDWEAFDLPGIGQIEDGETVYTTSIAEVFGRDDERVDGPRIGDTDDPRLREWWQEIEQIIEGGLPLQGQHRRTRSEPPDPHCAWYRPIHFFGHGWESTSAKAVYCRTSSI